MLAMLYFCLVLILLNHRPKYGRWILGYLDSRLNQDVTKGHHTYDDNCEITWENVADNFDHYYAVHLGNWFLSSFVIRDFYILHFWQVLDEFVELSWQHILPHFRECWWDHIFCDILLSNIPAITFGLWVQK
jgi:phosphatidylserine synthase 2